MENLLVPKLVFDLLIILAAGLIAGIISKRTGVSMLVGFLVVGMLIGPGALGLVASESHELEYLAQAGVLLLLFSVGIQFTLDELVRLSRYFFLGGAVQMALVAVPTAVVCHLFGMALGEATLVAGALALSSTVVVFKALQEWGQASSRHGHRAIGILLFQDVALVPLILLVPLLSGVGQRPSLGDWQMLALRSITFVVAVVVLRIAVGRWGVPLLARMRSTELVVLFTVLILGGACLGTYAIGLPPALGALSAGVLLSGNRLTAQFDALMLPYRETFAAVFFVSLGTLMQFDVLVSAPVLVVGAMLGTLLLKTAAAAVALRLVGLRWLPAMGMGLGLAQLGELSFVLLAVGATGEQPVVDPVTYHRMLFVALGTLALTPQLLKIGLRWAEKETTEEASPGYAGDDKLEPIEHAIVVGAGPIGSRVASQLETLGWDVCLVDLSPVNLHLFAQQGFRTITGDAAEAEVLRRAEAQQCRLAVVTVPNDAVAIEIVRTTRRLNPGCEIVVRCRYQANVAQIERAGAGVVVSEETEVVGSLLQLLESSQRRVDGNSPEDREIS